MYKFANGLILTIILHVFNSCSSFTTDDAYLQVPEIITKYGYPVEVHYVTTPDGYILALHRIPYGKKHTKVPKKPLLAHHGIFCSSANFVTSKERSLGFILADEGYDVWLANARGNREARNHTNLNPNTDKKFWDFSWHEVGVIDLPELINYVLKVTAQSSLYYVGYSQGSTVLYVLLSTYPEYNSKIRVHIDLAPGGFKNGGSVLNAAGIYELFPYDKLRIMIEEEFCRFSPQICLEVLFLICGRSWGQLDASILPNVLGHMPTAASSKQVFHYLQLVESGYFRQYDYGKDNIKVYGTEEPPSYNLSSISTPGFVFYSPSDNIVAADDIVRVCDQMGKSCVQKFLVDNFNHIDYLYGNQAPGLYAKIINLMRRY